MRIRRFALSLVLAVSLAVGASACFGKFAATRGLYNWNQQISGNKFVQTLVMWGLIIIPAYELFGLGDFIIFNVIEFWTGSNVLADADDGRAATLADVEVERDASGKVTFTRGERQFVVEPTGEQSLAVRIDGKVVGTGEWQEDQSLVLFDPSGNVVQTLMPGDLDDLRAHAEQLPVTL